MRVLILEYGLSDFDSLRGTLRLLRDEMKQAQHDVHTLDLGDPDWGPKLAAAHARNRFELAVGISGIGVEVRSSKDGKLYWESIQLPLFNWNCDHAAYFTTRHLVRSPYLLHGYVFPDHARFSLFHLRGNAVAFHAHMGIPERGMMFPQAPLPLAQRNGRIVFSKVGGDPAAIEAQWQAAAYPYPEILHGATEELLESGTVKDAYPVLERVAAQFGIFLHPTGAAALTMVRELDNYIRTRRSTMVAAAIVDYPVDVYGGGWDHIDWRGRKAAWKGPLAWSEFIRLLPTYLGCLSTNPMVDESVHERSFYSLAANVVPVADSNAFSRRHLSSLEPYSFRFNPPAIREAVERVLQEPAKALALTEQCWESLYPEFSMARSAERILAARKFVSVNGQASP